MAKDNTDRSRRGSHSYDGYNPSSGSTYIPTHGGPQTGNGRTSTPSHKPGKVSFLGRVFGKK